MAPAPPTPPARLPEFSTHVFADDPQLRAVTLDGRRLTEGDLISPGMRLLEITESGVVLDVNGERVVFDVLQDWRS
jgi:general secretion pathway protein B